MRSLVVGLLLLLLQDIGDEEGCGGLWTQAVGRGGYCVCFSGCIICGGHFAAIIVAVAGEHQATHRAERRE